MVQQQRDKEDSDIFEDKSASVVQGARMKQNKG